MARLQEVERLEERALHLRSHPRSQDQHRPGDRPQRRIRPGEERHADRRQGQRRQPGHRGGAGQPPVCRLASRRRCEAVVAARSAHPPGDCAPTGWSAIPRSRRRGQRRRPPTPLAPAWPAAPVPSSCVPPPPAMSRQSRPPPARSSSRGRPSRRSASAATRASASVPTRRRPARCGPASRCGCPPLPVTRR